MIYLEPQINSKLKSGLWLTANKVSLAELFIDTRISKALKLAIQNLHTFLNVTSQGEFLPNVENFQDVNTSNVLHLFD